MEDVTTQLAKKIYMGIFQGVLVVLFQPLDKEGVFLVLYLILKVKTITEHMTCFK